MPPKTRTNKTLKASKENACVPNTNKRNKLQKADKVVKPPRRALADKTNSASDDNASLLTNEKQTAKVVAVEKVQEKNNLNAERPRRVRRLPPRYKENNVLKNLTDSDISPSKENSMELKSASPVKKKSNSNKKVPVVVVSPLKTPVRSLNNSLIKNRPKRICRLPSKFDDHSISPNKFIPVQPINASTPLANKTKKINKEHATTNLSVKNTTPPAKKSNETPSKQKTLNDFFNKKTAADTNNNAKQKRQKPQNTPKKSPLKSKQITQKVGKNTSVKVLGDNKSSLKRDSSNLDIYEFTYDPEEEPPPTKKKKKRTVTKKPSKPKVTVKSNYDKNLAKALAALKSTVSSKTGLGQEGNTGEKTSTLQSIPEENPAANINSQVSSNTQITNQNKDLTISEPNTSVNKDDSVVNERNYNSVRVEDIAKDMQVEDDYNIDYSPVNSPCRPQTPAESHDNHQSIDRPNDDPLNLRDDISFFDEQPAASSSMNVSQRHPLASPWRVEFQNLPIKWHVNAYVKPNMTPAVETSFINFNDSKKKHVYTNMVPEANESLPQVVETTPNLKQTSIISFIKEVVEKNSNKKRKLKATPVKANSLFEDISNTSIVDSAQKKQPLSNNRKIINLTPIKDISLSKSNNSSNVSNETEKSDNQENVAVNENVASPNVQKEKTDKDVTYFGFDEIEDQENISPKKKNNKARALRARTRGILQELNVQKGPTRANVPVAVKSKPIQSSDVVDKLFDGVKSATEPPVFPDVAVNCNTEVETTTISEPAVPETMENEDSESVHLFEDIEFIHHHKPSRKSYGKSKKVAFSKTTVDNDSDSSNEIDQALSDEDLDDLSFKLPSEKPKKTIKKKKSNKQKLSKKEEKEAEAWAAGFNSMCEDIDEFDLVVE